MEDGHERHEFASDNTAAICPEAWAAMEEANVGAAASYGDDQWTVRVQEQVRQLFEIDCAVYLVFTGTAANALALAQICHSFHSVVCHHNSHINTDECGASEFFTKGSKLLLTGGQSGKVDLNEAKEIVERQPELHAHKPRAVSITQSTEFGSVYTLNEIGEISEFARNRKMFLHMDGARFANAVASIGCPPKTLTWQAGVDVLCFGGIKNGVAAGELVVFFQKQLADEFDYRVKQAGQLGSKMRFMAAQWLGLLNDNVWLENARRSNASARQLANRLEKETGIEVVFPVEANAIFVRMTTGLVRGLQARGWQFYKFLEPDIYRIMCSWAVSQKEMTELVDDVKILQSA
jgi:threonine aldolase